MGQPGGTNTERCVKLVWAKQKAQFLKPFNPGRTGTPNHQFRFEASSPRSQVLILFPLFLFLSSFETYLWSLLNSKFLKQLVMGFCCRFFVMFFLFDFSCSCHRVRQFVHGWWRELRSIMMRPTKNCRCCSCVPDLRWRWWILLNRDEDVMLKYVVTKIKDGIAQQNEDEGFSKISELLSFQSSSIVLHLHLLESLVRFWMRFWNSVVV